MRISFLLIGLIYWSYSLTGQSNFVGTIINSEDQEGIHNVTVKYGDGGVITNESGMFVIQRANYPLVLEISHLSYYPKKIIIRSPIETGIIISLIPKSIDINEVQVFGERITRFFPKSYYYIMDYFIFDDKILTIGYENRRMAFGNVNLIDFNQDTLANMPLKRPKKIFKDGFGNLHIYAGDSVYQVFIDGNEMQLIYPTLREEFSRDLLRFQFSYGSKYIFKMNSGEGQANEYYAIDSNTKERTDIGVVYESDLFSSAEEAKKYVQWNPDLSDRMSSNASSVASARDIFEAYVYDRFIVHRQVTSSLFKIGDRLVLFDFINSNIITYNRSLEQIGIIENSFPRHHQRKKIVIQDPITMKLYWIFYKGSKVELGEIDIESGEIIQWIETPSLPFIENVRIRGGVIWFLYQPRLGETVRSLFRMNI